ncbi:hypothetical protein Mapa_007261 [Marchantia paleacea]|nr:hypothetical protein Mapa_007261 [Marchantia paleacea]
MGNYRTLAFTLWMGVCLQSIIHMGGAQPTGGEETKLFIVYLGKNPHPTVEATHAAHHQYLSHVFESKENALESLVYHYKHAFSGFSAMLTQAQADILSQLPEVVSVFESQELKAQTTRSYSYLGLETSTGIWPTSNFGADVIIGVMDSGIWPESESFIDTGLTEIPARWKGTCEAGEQFDPAVNWNKKLIGARFFNKGYEARLLQTNETTGQEYVKSARDTNGHGTHCASTAAGARVESASLFGLANGSAIGGAPSARLAVYKTSWGRETETSRHSSTDSDILAAFDLAVLDGVDILSVSMGGDIRPFYSDSLAIGSYHANENGILVSISAGNSGPEFFSVSNIAPWQLTVAASTTDRQFEAQIELGDGIIVLVIETN